MTLQTNELYSENSRGAMPRVEPAEGPGSLVVRQFKTGTGTLTAGTPVGIESASGFMVKLAPAGTAHATAVDAEVMVGVVWPADVTLNGSGEVHGTVMMRGQANLDDLATALGVAVPVVDANLLLALRNPKVRNTGLHIDGLTIAK